MAAVRYIVEDVEASVRFYQDVLGFELQGNWGGAFAIVQHGDLTVWLSGPTSSARRPLMDGALPIPGGFLRAVIIVENIEAACEKLRAAGALRNPPISGPGGSQALAQDPCGNLIELFQPR